jgi:hypothetical protein
MSNKTNANKKKYRPNLKYYKLKGGEIEKKSNFVDYSKLKK